MRHNRLLNLFANNAKRGEFKAEGNTLYLYDAIVSSKAEADWFGGVDAETFVKALAGMTGDVSVRINSPGGDVFAGVAIAAAIKAHPGNVTVSVDGYAASAASVVAIAGDKVEMAAGSFMMIHKAWTFALGNADDMTATASLLEKIDGSLAAGYAASAEKRGVAPADFAAMMTAETWLSPQDAIDAGLADSVTESTVKAAAWDMSAYDHAPKAEAEAAPATNELTINIDTSGVVAAIEAALPSLIAAATGDAVNEPAAKPADNTANEIAARERQHAVRMRLQAA